MVYYNYDYYNITLRNILKYTYNIAAVVERGEDRDCWTCHSVTGS
jgi:hypothetical protein